MESVAAAAPGEETTTNDAELNAVAMLAALLILVAALIGGRVVQRSGVKWIGEASVGLIIGLVVGLVLHAAHIGPAVGGRMSFKASVFLLVFMPTIMFHAGYTLDAAPFIMNIGSICMTAFIGTTISTFVIGLLMWAFGLWGWCYSMPLLYNLTFGAIISATDPVAVLAVFDNLHANQELYINVFGESVLNDAVAMVLYNTISRFLQVPVTTGGVFQGIGIFIGIFVGSVVVGIVLAILTALLFKTGYFHAAVLNRSPAVQHHQPEQRPVQAISAPETPVKAALSSPASTALLGADRLQEVEAKEAKGNGLHALTLTSYHKVSAFEGHAPPMPITAPQSLAGGREEEEEGHDEQASIYETALALTLAYISYMAATALFLSGITAIISTGMMMNAYLKPNMSKASNLRVSVVSKTLAITFELFAFVYIGLSVLQLQDWKIVRYTILCLFALAISRACNIYPLCFIVNYLRPPQRRISQRMQFMMWWSGLRGPMAFALALDASEKYGEHGLVMKTCTLFLIVITVLFNGGLAAFFMTYLKLRAEDSEEEASAQPCEQEADSEGLLEGAAQPQSDDHTHALSDDCEAGVRPPLLGRLPSIAEDARSGDSGNCGSRLSGVRSEVSMSKLGKSQSLKQLPRVGSGGGGGGVQAVDLAASSWSVAENPAPPAPKLLAKIRDFNSGRLSQKLRGIDQAVSKMLLPAGSLERGNSFAAASPVLSPVPSTGRPGDALLGQAAPASPSRTAGQR